MKLVFSSFLLLLLMEAHAQVCTGNFVFHTQAEIDQFLIDNPTCTSINGNVTITAGPSQTSGFITNVNALQNIQSITGSLHIDTDAGPFSLQGLSALTTISGGLDIWDYGSPSLFSFEGLNNLWHVGSIGLTIQKSIDFSPFIDLSSTSSITIFVYANNEPIEMWDIFPSITTLSTGFGCTIENATTVNFTGLYYLVYAGSVSFTHYAGGVNYFDAFNSLTSVQDGLTIDVTFVNQFYGLEQLESVGWSMILYLKTTGSGFPTFSQLASVGDDIYIHGGGLNIPPLHFWSLTDVQDIIFVGKFPEVHFEALQSAHALTFQYDDLWVTQSSNPTTFDFPTLYETDFLTLNGMENTDLSAFPVLNNLYIVDIQNCPNLSECAIEAMCERLSINPAAVTLNNNAPGCSTVDEVLNDCELCYTSGQVYADMNCDGALNAGDIPFQNSIIHNQYNLPVGSINANGSYYVVIPENASIQIHSMVPPGFFAGPEYTLTYAYGDDYLGYNFPLCPNLNFHDVRVYGYLESPRPGYACEYSISLKNEVVPAEDVLLTLDFSNMPGATITSTDGTVSGNTVTWTVNDLTFLETNYFSADFYVDPSTPLGTIYTPVVTATLLSAPADDDPADNVYTLSRTVTGSYDPNIKTVNRESINVAEIPSDDGVWLDYTIQFQNTGTAEAITVRVDDVIADNLDLSTFQSLDASHFYEVSFDENRNVSWLFENIMLADSASNEPESHGFIHFKIKTMPGLGVTDVVENNVAIYFDFNEPVITNTATTIFYECVQNAEILGAANVCEGSSVALDASGLWDDYIWTLDANSIGTSNQLTIENLAAGQHTISLHVSDAHCADETEFVIDVAAIPETPTITRFANTLTASGSGIFEWSLNGEILADTDNEIVITESNVYSVTVNENGCVSAANSATYDLFVCPAPLELPQDLSICEGDIIELNVPDAYISLEWKWQETDEVIGTSADLNFSPTSSGSIVITGSSYDCISTDALFVTINPIPASPVITQAGNTLTASGSGIFEWSMNGEILADTDNEIVITESNVYSVTVNNNGCVSAANSATYYLFVCPAPLELPQDLIICEGDAVELNVPDAYMSLEWKWQETDEVIGTSADLNFTPTTSGTIVVSGVSYDCTSSDVLLVTMNPIPSSPVVTQAGNTLTASGSGIFEWSMNGEVLADTDNEIVITESNVYSVTVNENGCVSAANSASYDLFVCPAPLELPQDLSMCDGDLVDLNVPNDYMSLEWTWQETGEVIGTGADLLYTPTTSGTITVTGVSYDCTSSDAINLLVNPIPQAPVITQTGNTLTASGTGTFEWSMNGEVLVDTDNSIEITESNTYSVSLTENGCESEVTSGAYTYTSIAESMADGVEIYPNPVSTVLNLNLPNNGIWQMEIVSSEGKLLYKTQVTGGRKSIDILPEWNGLLMISLLNENSGVQVQEKVMVVR